MSPTKRIAQKYGELSGSIRGAGCGKLEAILPDGKGGVTMHTMKRPRQRGPIGRKMWQDDLGMVYHYRETALRGACGVESFVGRVLVIPLDPANVERIREQMREVIEQFGITTKGTFRFISHDPQTMAEAISNSLNLTPAKRRGK